MRIEDIDQRWLRDALQVDIDNTEIFFTTDDYRNDIIIAKDMLVEEVKHLKKVVDELDKKLEKP